jgi:hypothetical protein
VFSLATTTLEEGHVFIVVALLVLPLAAIAFAASGPALRQLGKGRFAIEQELPRKTMGPHHPAISPEMREAEIRQMLEAKSYRRQMRGEPALDVEAEYQRLIEAERAQPPLAMDAELREEVRQLVIARNERRMRKGLAPLDIDDEIARQMTDLENLGQ